MRQRSVLGSGVSGSVIYAIFLPWFYISILLLSIIGLMCPVWQGFCSFFALYPLLPVFRHFNTIWIALTKERLWFSEICCCAANCENVWTADHFICKFSALPWLAADRGGRGLIVKYFQVISTHWPKFCPFSFCCSWLANILRVFKLYWGEKAENKVLIKTV